jgi:tagaturonate reductase
MTTLNKSFIDSKKLPENISPPANNWDNLPDKVLQFGTGVLLRGLPDYFIDKANREGYFNGRVVVVKSTETGALDEFTAQDGLYTLHVKGIHKGQQLEETFVISSISKVLSAVRQWEAVLDTAILPSLEIVLSNTTEAGIVLDEQDDLDAYPPVTFPGKLTTLLYKRFQHFNKDITKGLVILPTELIPDNGTKLKEIIIRLAQLNQLDEDFVHWLHKGNHFCNTLVDRIVPGKPSDADKQAMEEQLGYTDGLAILAEPFKLWAIESDSNKVVNTLSFGQFDEGVVIVPSIWKYKELKLRLLNGSHSFSCGLALLCGFTAVKDAMQNPDFSKYVRLLLEQEIVPTIINSDLSKDEALQFVSTIIDRFSNPFIDHKWVSISMNYTFKMQVRNVPLIEGYMQKQQRIPEYMALGFAAYLHLMKDGTTLDEQASLFAGPSDENNFRSLINTILKNKEVWKTDLSLLPGFADAVANYFHVLQNNNALTVIKQLNDNLEGPG